MQPKNIIHKKNVFLTIFTVITVLLITLVILVFTFIKDLNLMTLCNLILMVILLANSLYFRQLLTHYNNLSRIAKVMINQSPPLEYKHNITTDPSRALNLGFKFHANTPKYSILYNHVTDNTLKVKKIKKLYIVLILKDESIDFYNKNMHDDINKLESSFDKKEFPNKYVITAFKTYNEMSEKAVKEIGEVVLYSAQRQTYLQVNVGLSKEDNLAYFLYSEQYMPNQYYMQAINQIKSLI